MFRTIRFILQHPLNRGRPLSALARYASWQIRSRLQDEVIVDWIEGAKLVARSGMTGATGNIYCGLHEYVDMSFVLHLLRPGDLFVDVGANIGSYTLLASRVRGATSIAIEPDPDTVQYLERNLSENTIKELVEVQQTAIGDRSGTILFTVGRDTTNQVASGDCQNVQTVPLSRLDDILEKRNPTLIKFDLEGYETMALRGAKNSLASSSLLAVLLETVDVEAQGILEGCGFREVAYDPSRRRLGPASVRVASNRLYVKDASVVTSRLIGAPDHFWLSKVLV